MIKKLALFITMLVAVASTTVAQNANSVAVYVVGDISGSEKRVLETELLKALVSTGRFTAVEGFTAKAVGELSEAVDDEQVSRLAGQFGARFVCIAELEAAFGMNVLSARVLSTENAKVLRNGMADGQLSSMMAVQTLTKAVVTNMLISSVSGSADAKPQAAPSSASAAQTSTSAPAPIATKAPPPAPAAPASYSWPPKVAVYVTGLAGPLNNALSRAVSSALMKSGIYEGIERMDQHMSGSGAPSNDRIIQAAKQAGIDYVFVINAAGQITVAIIDANLASETAKVSLNGKMSSPLDAAKMAISIVNFIQKSGPKPPPGYTKPAAQTAEEVEKDGKKQSNGSSAGVVVLMGFIVALFIAMFAFS